MWGPRVIQDGDDLSITESSERMGLDGQYVTQMHAHAHIEPSTNNATYKNTVGQGCMLLTHN